MGSTVTAGIISYYRPKLRERLVKGDKDAVPNWIRNAKRGTYILRAILSVPIWVQKHDLLEIEQRAKERTKITGRLYVIDHEIPINHPRVCGLTVPTNLKIVLWEVNAKKGNAWCEWHGELFPEGEQLHLFRQDK